MFKIFFSMGFIFTLFACNEKQVSSTENVYYKTLSEDSEIIDYILRSYHFDNDTMTLKEVTIRKNYESYTQDKLFLISENGLSILTKFKDSTSVDPFLTVTKIDSCNFLKHPLGNYNICYEGKHDFMGYKNCYKFDHSDEGIDGLNMTVYLDSNYMIVAQIARLATFEKILKIDETEIPRPYLLKLKKGL